MPRPIALGCLALALSFDAAVDGQTQLDMNRAADRALHDAENMLAVAVTIYRESLKESQRAAFDEWQRNWVAYRKATCDFQTNGIAESSNYEMILALCLTKYANERVDAIMQLVNCALGDVVCPVPGAAPNNRWRGP